MTENAAGTLARPLCASPDAQSGAVSPNAFRERFEKLFRELFSSDRLDLPAIHLALQEMVRYVSRSKRIRHASKGSRNDHESDVLIFAITLLPKVNPASNPAAFFRTAINRKFWELIQSERKRPCPVSNLPEEEFRHVVSHKYGDRSLVEARRTLDNTGGAKPTPVDATASIRRKGKVNLPAITPAEVRVMRNFFETRIRRTIRTIQAMEGAVSTDPEHSRLLHHAYGVLDALQEGQFFALRKFKACSLKLVRFTPDQRLPLG